MNEKIDFSEITKEDILIAFEKYEELSNKNMINKNRNGKEYILFWNSKEYPHKYIVGIAYGLKYNQEPLDNTYYNSMGNHKSSAQWCLEKNGFILYADKKYKEYLQKKYNNQTTINTYYSDLKKAIKIFQNIEQLRDKDLNEILKIMKNGGIDFDDYDKSQKELGFNDKQLFSTLKTKAKTYLESINNENIVNSEGIEMQNENKQIQPLNQILFGPPGTGKTFNTINKAIEIIENRVLTKEELTPENRIALKDKFEEYKKAGLIEFVTFHQSYGYEEFVEGIKAIPVGKEGNEDGNEMIYDVSSGIFKKLSNEAFNNSIVKKQIFKESKKRFNLNAPMINIQAEMIKDDENSFRVLKGSKIRKAESNSFPNKKLKNEVLSKVKKIEYDEFYILEEDYTFQSMSASSSVILGRASNGYSDWKEVLTSEEILTSYSNSEEPIKNYILIIDEINRGNISKIFGELITLIEPSKRIGADEEIKVKLPYSNDDFGVPQNLYILGTMNTADRSIALMDTALRRRFEFIEMLPDLEVLDGLEVDGINVKSMLGKINQRVEYLYDRDHTIGHAYFMSLKDNPTLEELENIFKNKIIPLLQEYFYDDWEKILMVIGKGFIEIEVIKDDIFDYKVDDYLEEEKCTYKIKNKFDFSSFK